MYFEGIKVILFYFLSFSSRGIDYVFAGLANGKLAIFDSTRIVQVYTVLI